MSSETSDVLVLGASFAGIEVVFQSQRRRPKPLKITVVDRIERHGYIPLVHERLCGRLPLEESELLTAEYLRSLPGVRFVHDEVVSFDPEQKVAVLGSGQRLSARFVVVALGSVLAPPPDLAGREHLLGHKFSPSLEAAKERLSEIVASASGDREGEAQPRVVVVGGGISGVELAGELALLAKQRPEGWCAPAVTLVVSGASVLDELAPGVGRKAAAALRAQGVDLRLQTRLVEVEPDAAVLRCDGQTERLECAATFWSGGLRPAPVLEHLGLPRTEGGWLEVGPTLQCFPSAVPTKPEIFACGDAVRIEGGEGVWPTMQRAIECLWQAKVVARNLVTLAAQPPDYPKGVPPLRPHVLRPRFAYGVSLGAHSLVVYGAARIDLPGINTWFRRWLMRQYFARYLPRGG